MDGKDGEPADDFSIETSDLPANTRRRVPEGQIDLGARLLHGIRSVKISLRAAEFPAYEDDGFEIEMSDLSSSTSSRLHDALAAEHSGAQAHTSDARTFPYTTSKESDEDGNSAFDVRIEDIARAAIQQSAPPSDRKLAFKLPVKRRTGGFLFLLLIFSLVFINVLGSTPALSRLPDIIARFRPAAPTPTAAYISERVAWIENGSTNINSLTSQPQSIVPVTVLVGPETVLLTPGAMPTSCPPGPLVDNQHTVGYYPVEIAGFDGPQASIHIHQTTIARTSTHAPLQNDIQDWKGWAVTLKVAVAPGYGSFLVLSAGNMDSGTAPTFAPTLASAIMAHTGPPSSITLDYRASATKARSDTREVTMYLAGSGCYYINVFWQHGNWQLPFAAGQ